MDRSRYQFARAACDPGTRAAQRIPWTPPDDSSRQWPGICLSQARCVVQEQQGVTGFYPARKPIQNASIESADHRKAFPMTALKSMYWLTEILKKGLMKYSNFCMYITYCYTMVNKYYKRSKISEAKFRQILKYFSMDLTATETATLSSVSLRSVTVIFDKLRAKICYWCMQEALFEGTIEVDETYFGLRRVPGKRGRGVSGKTMVFGIFKRQGKVYTEIVPDASKKTL